MQVRQKLTEFESTIAFVVGGGMALIVMALALASIRGGSPDAFNLMLLVGALFLVLGTLVWAFTARPWTKHDDWSEPLYTGHEHEHHDEAHHDAHTESLTADVGVHGAVHADHVPPPTPESAAKLEHATAAAPSPAAAIAKVESVAAAAKHRHEPTETSELPTEAVSIPPLSRVADADAPKEAPPTNAYIEKLQSIPSAQVEAPRQADTTPVADTPAAETPVAQPAKVEAAAVSAEDDLTVIEGIGPKISGALKAAGILTFAKLAALSPEEIEQIVRAANVRMIGKATTWPRQAELAAAGKFEELKTFQATLSAGREGSDD